MIKKASTIMTAQQQAEAERQQKEAAQQQAEEFKRMLKALGVDPDAL